MQVYFVSLLCNILSSDFCIMIHECMVLELQSKIPRRKDHCDPYDHSCQHGSTTKLYVGNMSRYTRERDLEAAFGRYGR